MRLAGAAEKLSVYGRGTPAAPLHLNLAVLPLVRTALTAFGHAITVNMPSIGMMDGTTG